MNLVWHFLAHIVRSWVIRLSGNLEGRGELESYTMLRGTRGTVVGYTMRLETNDNYILSQASDSRTGLKFATMEIIEVTDQLV